MTRRRDQPRDPGHDTRALARQEATSRSAADRQQILAMLQVRGKTRWELSHLLSLPYTTISARVTELKAAGLVEDTDERRPTGTGSSAAVQRIKPPPVVRQMELDFGSSATPLGHYAGDV